MAKTEGENQTVIMEFILLGFGNVCELQSLLFLLFLVIYIVTMTGNILAVVLVVANQQLHTPMYLFLGNLSCLETCYTSNILPRMLASFLTGNRAISVNGCMTQFYFAVCFVGAECSLLAAMSYDRYSAICKPLYYTTHMNGRFCLQLAAGSWVNGFLAMVILIFLMPQLNFCGSHEIDHFYCESTEIINHYCSDTTRIEQVVAIVAAIFTLPSFLLTVTSYMCIITTILRIPSTTGRQKAFSTCSSHIIVVTTFYGPIMILYMLPKTSTQTDLNKLLSLCYTVLTPMVNPFIYSLRNREVKKVVGKMVSKSLDFTRIQKSQGLSSYHIKRKS